MKVVTAGQMRQVEERAVARGVALDGLMENAGRAVADAVADWLVGSVRVPFAPPETFDDRARQAIDGKRIAVLIGPGNNGEDGFVAARHLAARGLGVQCLVVLPRKTSSGKQRLAEQAGAQLVDAARPGGMPAIATSLDEADAILDAVFGIGQSRPIAEPLVGILRAARSSGKPVLAVDLPTGTNADTGAFDPNGLPATATFMLGLPKMGPVVNPVTSRCGQIKVLDIGLTEADSSTLNMEWLTKETAHNRLGTRDPAGHKGTYGRVAIIGGSANYVGAPLLAAEGALRSGAGLVELALPRSVYEVAAGRLALAIYSPLSEDSSGQINSVAAGQQAIRAIAAASALLIGPGLGQGRATAEFVNALLSHKPEQPPAVIDADALNVLSSGYKWWERLSGPAILTPHPGEMGRLMGMSAGEVQKDRFGVAKSATEKWGAVVVLKGAATIVAAPDGKVGVSPFVNSGLAKGGTGDVLAGLIAGLLAQKPSDLFGAACLGVYLHGSAGEYARNLFGENAMTAEDVVESLEDAFTEVSRIHK